MGQIHRVLFVAANLVSRIVLPLLVVIDTTADGLLFFLLFELIIFFTLLIIAEILNVKLSIDVVPAVRYESCLKLTKPICIHIDLLTDLIFRTLLVSILLLRLTCVVVLIVMLLLLDLLLLVRLELELIFFVASLSLFFVVVLHLELLLSLLEVSELHLILQLEFISIPTGLLCKLLLRTFLVLIIFQFVLILIRS